MENDVYAFALRSTLNEIMNACPNIRSIFLFKEDGDIISGEEKAPEEATVRTVNALDAILEKAETLGGLQNITLESAEGTVKVSRMEDFYLVTVVPKEADLNYINTLTGALVPTVLKVLEKINPISNRDTPSEPEIEEPIVKPDVEPVEASKEEIAETDEENHEEQALSEASSERSLPEPQVNQFIVGNIGGLFSPSDVVRVDNDIMSQWADLYDNKKIEEATIETFGGKSTRCKLKPIKDSKYEGKGIIQIPEKIQQILDVGTGELVRVKPVIE
jgi:predicted regulator of Ras-like GTPase activity (Roadblock/LC7/MglB family)